jgi:pyruvate kinase
VQTKIVATIGPTSEQAGPLRRVVEAGMRVMRLNFSHATAEEVRLRCANLEAATESVLTPNADAAARQDVTCILLDTKGPEIRTGILEGDDTGHKTIDLARGSTVTLHCSPKSPVKKGGGTPTDLFVDLAGLAEAVEVGGRVVLDDGAVELSVVSSDPARGQVACEVAHGGSIRSRAGVFVPGADLADTLPALSDKDRDDIVFGMREADIDCVAASFVQSAAHVRDVKKHIAATAKKLKWKGPLPLVISKIETASALHHFDEILAESDGIMVARGDVRLVLSNG